jgi:hypothetical protein
LLLLTLFFVGLFFTIRADHPFMAGFYHVSEVIIAIAAGIIASTITGFFKLEIDQKIGTQGRFVIQACGGFAVFVLVMYLSPRQKMHDLSSLVFSHLISDCKSALGSTTISSQSRAVCVELTHAFPSRAEAWELLGRLDHMRSSRDSAQSAMTSFAKAIAVWGLREPTIAYGDAYSGLSNQDRIDVSELLRHYAYARGTVLVGDGRAAQRAATDYDRELTNIVQIVNNALKIAGPDPDSDFVVDMHDIRGKLYYYRHFQVGDDGESSWLGKARREFEAIADAPDGCNVWPRYHVFLAATVLAEASAQGPCHPELTALLDALMAETKRCAVLQGLESNFWTNYKFVITGMFVYDDRDEAFELTSELGSHQFGGSSVMAFAKCNATAIASMTQLLGRL